MASYIKIFDNCFPGFFCPHLLKNELHHVNEVCAVAMVMHFIYCVQMHRKSYMYMYCTTAGIVISVGVRVHQF